MNKEDIQKAFIDFNYAKVKIKELKCNTLENHNIELNIDDIIKDINNGLRKLEEELK